MDGASLTVETLRESKNHVIANHINVWPYIEPVRFVGEYGLFFVKLDRHFLFSPPTVFFTSTSALRRLFHDPTTPRPPLAPTRPNPHPGSPRRRREVPGLPPSPALAGAPGPRQGSEASVVRAGHKKAATFRTPFANSPLSLPLDRWVRVSTPGKTLRRSRHRLNRTTANKRGPTQLEPNVKAHSSVTK